MGPIGVVELIFISTFFLLPVLVIGVFFGIICARRARRFGYRTRRDYLAAAPKSDNERRDAADLALKGLVFCLLGLLFAPLVLFGLFPLFYGGRKLVYASLGLGLVDDRERFGA